MSSFSELDIGDQAVVVGYVDEGEYPERLKSLGLVPGTSFVLLRAAPLGDPIEIRVRGFSLAIRAAEADCLQVRSER